MEKYDAAAIEYCVPGKCVSLFYFNVLPADISPKFVGLENVELRRCWGEPIYEWTFKGVTIFPVRVSFDQQYRAALNLRSVFVPSNRALP